MNEITRTPCAVLFICTLGIASNSSATVVGYTDYDDFNAAISGMSSTTEDFETYAAGTVIPNGATLGGIGYEYDMDGDELSVDDGYDTTSGSNFLGTTESDELILNGELLFSLSFGAVHAVGMYFVTADVLDDGDIKLAAGNTIIALSTTALVETLPDSSEIYFLGFVDNSAATLTSVDIRTSPVGVFGYNIDDIVRATRSAVPIPGSIPLLVLGIAAVTFSRRASNAPRPL